MKEKFKSMISLLIGRNVPDLFESLEMLGTWDGDVLTVAGYRLFANEGKLVGVTDPNGNRLESEEFPEFEYDEEDDSEYDYECELIDGIYATLREMTRFTESEIKEWLRRMNYTVKVGSDGTPYVFLSILCGKGKVNSVQMTQIAEYAYKQSYPEGRFSLNVWIGGKVDWMMIYDQPFSRVNGKETFSCSGIGMDNYSPDDWEADMVSLGGHATQKEYIEFLFNGRKVA